MDLPYDQLLQFLLNNLFKSGFFKSDNYDNFDKMMNTVKIKTDLIKNLENELTLELKLKNIEELINKNSK